MPRYLYAPQVTVLLSKVTDLRKRLFIDTQWNTGGRLNEILPLTQGDFVLDDPLSAAPLVAVCGATHAQAAQAGRICRQWVPSPRVPDKRRTAG